MTTKKDYTAQHIANFMLKKAYKHDVNMTPMKLIKMVYIAHGWSLAALDMPLLFGEPVEAWKHGPVIPSLYHEFKRFGSRNISGYAENTDIESEKIKVHRPQVDSNNDDLMFILNSVWDIYHKYTGVGLRNHLHMAGTPWKDVYQPHKNIEITDEATQTYYKTELTRMMNA